MSSNIEIKNHIKSALESMMYIWGEPLDIKTAGEVLAVDKKVVYEHFKALQKEYEEMKRGIVVIEINKGFQFATAEENYTYLKRLCNPAKEKKLSPSSLEVLSIIAYKQPVTKSEIDSIRGVKSDRSIEGLAKKDLIEEKGRSQAIGKPILYGTTNEFLKHFGLENIGDLPDIESIENVLQDVEEDSLEKTAQMSLDI